MPPIVHSSRIEKPEGMSLTWKPRLVKTPTPTISATTMAVATMTETVVPPPENRPGQAALPVSDAAMPIHALRVTPVILHRAGSPRSIQAMLTRRKYRPVSGIIVLPRPPGFLRHCEIKVTGPQSRHDFVFAWGVPGVGSFPGCLTSPQR